MERPSAAAEIIYRGIGYESRAHSFSAGDPCTCYSRLEEVSKFACILVNQRNHKEGEHGNAAWNYK